MAAGLVPQTIEIASIGIPDTMFLMLLALVVLWTAAAAGDRRQIGKLMYEFRKVSNDFKFQMEEELRRAKRPNGSGSWAAEQASRAALEAAPQPAESARAGTGSGRARGCGELGAESVAETVEAAPAVAKMRGEPRKFPNIQPPASGDPVAAQRAVSRTG